MSATIIRIMTSSSTRKTDQPAGRVAIMMESLLVGAPRFAKNTPRRNAGLHRRHDCLLTILRAVTPGEANGSRRGNQIPQEIFLNRPRRYCFPAGPKLRIGGEGPPRDIMSQEPPEKMMFLLGLRRRGISDQAVLRTMEEVPRDMFV